MAKSVILSVFILVSSHFVKVSEGGPIAYKQHRDTTLEELRSIDSYVSGALPVLQDGFFIGTSNGPVLVKSEPLPGVSKRPTVRSKYYNTLPRLIPAGFEGVATSHFNLGPASPIRPYSLSKNLVGFQAVAETQPQQYFATQTAQPTQQYIRQAQPAVEQSQQIYFPQTQEPQPQQYLTEVQQPQQFVAEAQQSQQYVSQPPQYQLPEQQFPHPEESHSVQQEFEQQQQLPQQYLVGRQVNSPQEPQYQQQQFLQQQQEIQDNYQNLLPQDSPQNEARSQSFQIFGTYPAQDTEQSFQVDNLLTPEDPPQTRTFQRQLFGTERFQSQELLPNAEVVAASEMEETLPEPLRNRFYKSANLATILAQESLPVQGEQIVGDWDTHKIAKGKIHALLQGAGLI